MRVSSPGDPPSSHPEIPADKPLSPHSGGSILAKSNEVYGFPKAVRGKNPIPLPPWDKMLKQPRSDVHHQNPRMLNLHAWKLSRPR